ncbi:N1R/p28 family protein [Fowlpox virus]|nr:N1R/p28 family protein [Fowlpox virus]
MDFSDLVTRKIDDRFCYIKYDKFDLIMMKENRFINATKLCKLGGKDFHRWKRLDGSKELMIKVNEMNEMWKSAPPPPDLGGIIIEVNGSNQYTEYDIAGSYVHQDLIPHIASWISPLFALKVSKIISCYVSGKYEFKLKEKENKIEELLDLLHKFNNKYDKDTLELKELYREQRKEAKSLRKINERIEEKYDKDTRELKQGLKELKDENKELKFELKKIEERLRDKVINPFSPNKHHRLVILQKKIDNNSFKTLRLQAERLNQEMNKYKTNILYFLMHTNLTQYPVLIG